MKANAASWIILSSFLFPGGASGTAKAQFPAQTPTPVLHWGADTDSGAPFAFRDAKDSKKVVGFEAEIVAALAKEMNLKIEFKQNSWEALVEGLKRGDYDMIVNGLEITPDRAEVVQFSQAYYVTAEVLAVQRQNNTITSLETAVGKRVGTLTGSLAQKILQEQKKPLEILSYAEEVNAYNDLANGRLDAVFMDEPIALYYAKPNPLLKIVGEPVGRMEYGIATRPDDVKLAQDVRAALERLIAIGTLRKILERWGLWNSLTAHQFGQSLPPQTTAVAYDSFIESSWAKVNFRTRLQRYISFLPQLGRGAIMTLEVSILSMMLAMMIGLVAAVARLYGPKIFSWMALVYVEAFRGTPLLIQLFLIFYGLPHLGIRLSPFVAAVIGLGLNYGASEAENYRAGILAIPKAQGDAAMALGMSRAQGLWHVIIPQALRVVIPPVTNDFIALLKDSSLVSVITMVELTSIYGQLASTYFDYLGIGLLTAAVYFLIGLPFVRLSRWLELRLNAHLNIKPRADFSRREPKF